VIRSKAIDPDQLFARLDDIRARTKSSIEISRRLIDQSFLRFKTTHRNLYAARQSQDRLNALPQTEESTSASRELSALIRDWERPEVLHSAEVETNSTCHHCEGILLNKKAYRVRTHDQGLILLDMVVCYACNLEAKNLGLETHELQASDNEPELMGNDHVPAVAYSV
jgi:RNase P subunit RPR2